MQKFKITFIKRGFITVSAEDAEQAENIAMEVTDDELEWEDELEVNAIDEEDE